MFPSSSVTVTVAVGVDQEWQSGIHVHWKRSGNIRKQLSVLKLLVESDKTVILAILKQQDRGIIIYCHFVTHVL